jgi:hypothetical protein
MKEKTQVRKQHYQNKTKTTKQQQYKQKKKRIITLANIRV